MRKRENLLTQRDFETLFGGRTRHQCLVPALDVRIIVEADLMALVPPGPTKDREIGNRHVIAARISGLAEAAVENALNPRRLLPVGIEPLAPGLFLLEPHGSLLFARPRGEA